LTLLVPELLPTQSYQFRRLRRVFDALGLQPGVYDAGDLKVTQRGAGANMSVDVAAGRAWVRGLDSLSTQGSYHCESDAVENKVVTAAHATLPRIDQVVARVYDTSVIGGGIDTWQLEVIAGTPTSGAQASNPAGANYRAGAVDLAAIAAPKTLIRAADIEVPAAASSIVNANIIDRRPSARGAFYIAELAGVDRTKNGATWTAIDATAWQPRIECSGKPMRVTMTGLFRLDIADANRGFFDVLVDASRIAKTVGFHGSVIGGYNGNAFVWHFTPTAGSHLIAPGWYTLNSATITLDVGSVVTDIDIVPTLTIEEIVRPNFSNG